MEFDNDAVFNKIYASFSLTGQSGPNGNGDIDDVDEGRSGMFRSQWYLNEFTADEAHWVWATDAHGERVAYSRLLFIIVFISQLHFVISI